MTDFSSFRRMHRSAGVALIALMSITELHATETKAGLGANPSLASEPLLAFDLNPQMLALSEDIQEEQDEIDEALDSLLARGASDAQIAVWRERNAPRFRDQENRARWLSAYFTLRPMEYMGDVTIPDHATKTVEDFLVLDATLFNRFAEIHNELVEDNGGAISPQNADEVEESANFYFRQENASDLERKTVLLKKMAEETGHLPIDSPTLTIPSGASPQLKAFLTLQFQIEQGRVAVHNQYCGGPQRQLDEALDRWQKQNIGRLDQLNQLALRLSEANSTSGLNQP